MNSLEASIRNTKTKGELNTLRQKGEVPAIIYGGTEENQKVSLSKKQIKYLIEQENFLSNIISLNIEGQTIKALPREVSFDIFAVIGPCISQENYEVKNDFKINFLNQSPKNMKHFKIIKNKIYFDLKGYIFRQLKNAGISNVEIIKKDTFNPRNNFFSARRSLKKKNNDYGRNISIIMIK